MNTKVLFLLILIGIISSNNLNAQEVCGTATPVNYQDYRTANRDSTSDETICINIYFHIVRETNGSGGINPNQLNNIINNLNQFYNVFDIYFSNIGFDYINNSNYVQVSENEANTLGQINNQSNAVNYYIVDALWNTGGGFVTGTALSIPSNRLIIRNDRVLSSTSPHEVGHCLNLLHTFETYYCTEAINGSNCSSCGDLVCDTPADANTGNSGGHSPDLTNIMSYYPNRNHFTDGQSIRMKSAILNNSLLQQVVGTSCSVPEINGQETICNSYVTTYTLSNGGNSVTWNVSSNLTILSQNSNSITVKPISTSINGAGFVEAILPIQNIRKEIWIGVPIVILDREGYDPDFPIAYDLVIRNAEFQGITNVIWQKVSGQGTISQNADMISAHVGGGTIEWHFNGKVTVTNSCGSTTKYFSASGGGNPPGGGIKFNRISNTLIKVEKSNQINGKTQNLSIDKDDYLDINVLDMNGNLFLKSNDALIDLSTLRKGMYIIQARVNDIVISDKIIIQ